MELWQDGVKRDIKSDSYLQDDCHLLSYSLPKLFLFHFKDHADDTHALSRRNGLLADGIPDFAVAEQNLPIGEDRGLRFSHCAHQPAAGSSNSLRPNPS